jgi:hypothetical protein
MIDTKADEIFEVVPIAQTGRGPPNDWWTVKRNGLPVRHFPTREKAELYATDPEYRASLARQRSGKAHGT